MRTKKYETIFKYFEDAKNQGQKLKVYLTEKKAGHSGDNFLMLSGIPKSWDEFSVLLERQDCIIPLKQILNIKKWDE